MIHMFISYYNAVKSSESHEEKGNIMPWPKMYACTQFCFTFLKCSVQFTTHGMSQFKDLVAGLISASLTLPSTLKGQGRPLFPC